MSDERIVDVSTPLRKCKTSDVDHLREFIAYAKLTVNKAWYFPPIYGYRYMVALGLYSKCLTVAEAIITLLDSGFYDEAFGMTRTLVDIFITLHYIANKDTDDRAKMYYEFSAKDVEVWNEKVIPLYWPTLAQTLSDRTTAIAATYPSPHYWSGKTTKDLALEPDTVEFDPDTGQPLVHDFAYRVIYRWTSHYVHPSIVALTNHLVQAGRDNFVVQGNRSKDMSYLAASNVASYVSMIMVCFYRCMGEDQPSRVGAWAGALVKHMTRRHRR
jgi:hypothetical protein